MSHIKLFEKQIDLFVTQNGLKPADAVLVKKMPYKLLNHYIIYLGVYRLRHIFMANTLSGIKIYNYSDLMVELQTLQPEKIDKFLGSKRDRELAVERALMRKDENSYHLILNNCEHFKNWVHKAVHESMQVKNAGKLAVGTGVTIAIASKSDGGKLLGLAMMLLGGIAWAFGDDQRNMPKLANYPKKR